MKVQPTAAGKKRGKVDVLFGGAWGGEGKSKVALSLIHHKDPLYTYGAVARYQGGPDKNHHVLPSGVMTPDTIILLGNDLVIDPVKLKREIEDYTELGYKVRTRLYISDKATLITPYHLLLDRAEKAFAHQSGPRTHTAATGIGPAFADMYQNKGLSFKQLREGTLFTTKEITDRRHLVMISGFKMAGFDYEVDAFDNDMREWESAAQWIDEHIAIIEMQEVVEELLAKGESILAESIDGVMQDRTHGEYPHKGYSNTCVSGIFTGLSIGAKDLGKKYLVINPYVTKVDCGLFLPSRMTTEHEQFFKMQGVETILAGGEQRIYGYLDLVLLRYAIMANMGYGTIEIVIAKTDVFPEELLEHKLCLVTQHKRTKNEQLEHTTKLEFPLNDIVGVETIEVDCWRTTAESRGLHMDLLVNVIENNLTDLPTGSYKFAMYSTGSEVEQYIVL